MPNLKIDELQVNWFKFNSNSYEYEEILRSKKHNVHSNGSLSIVDVHKEDIGTYEVQISNNAGITSEEVQVEIMNQTGW